MTAKFLTESHSIRSFCLALAVWFIGGIGESEFASAGVVTHTDTFGPQSYPFSNKPEGTTIFTDTRTGTMTFPMFDPALGTLDSVSVSFTSNAVATMIGQQTNQSSTNFANANMRVRYTLDVPSAALQNSDIFFNQTVSAPNPGLQINYSQQSHSPTSTTLVGAPLASFEGAGNISMTLTMDFLQNAFSSSSSLNYNFSSDTSTTASVTL